MKNITFITGNASKAKYMSKYLGLEIDHEKVDLDEIQSMDLKIIVSHKVRQAYNAVNKPVIVEDVSLEFEELNGLPGPFIKWFLDNLKLEEVCNLIKTNRKATARCVIGFYDGVNEECFEGFMHGSISEKPKGTNGYGWHPIFIPEGYKITMGEMSAEDDEAVYTTIKPFRQLKEYLENL